MNYRHAFHAGNFADVFKHAILLALLDALTAKDKPLCYFDTHAGRGSYRLDDAEALKTGEWRAGIGRLFDAPDPPKSLRRYLDAIRACNPDGTPRVYPGSPWLAAQASRANDRLVLCETQDDEAAALRTLFRDDPRAHVHRRDGYRALNALLPPAERRGMVLIDPPFEERSEFADLATAVGEALSRFETGTYVIWYPLKDEAAADRFVATATSRAGLEFLDVRLAVMKSFAGLRLTASGVPRPLSLCRLKAGPEGPRRNGAEPKPQATPQCGFVSCSLISRCPDHYRTLMERFRFGSSLTAKFYLSNNGV